MFGEYNNIIMKVFDSIARSFTDLSYKAADVLGDYGNDKDKRFQKVLYMFLGGLFLLSYGIAGLIGAILHIFIPIKKRQKNTKISFKVKELLCVFAVCILVFSTFFVLYKTDYAKNTNRVYYDSRVKINNICKNELPYVNSSDMEIGSYLYHLRNSLECSNTSSEVQAIRSIVNDSMPDGIHFATMNDYLIMLLSLEEFDSLDRFVSTYSDDDNTSIFHKYLNDFCKLSFQLSRFHTSETCLELIMKYAEYDSISSDSDYNNSYYLMRLFNENIMDRYYSCYDNNYLLSYIIHNVRDIKGLRLDKFMTPQSRHEKEIVEYLNNIKAFHNAAEDGIYPTERLLALSNRSKSEVIRQYSLNMALRSQWEYTNRLIRNEANAKTVTRSLAELERLKDAGRLRITYPYLYSDIELYKIDDFN